jgi:hypothetical protein
MKGELGAPVSGDDEEGCNAGGCYSRLTAFLSLPVVSTVFLFSFFFYFPVLEMKKLSRYVCFLR